MRLRTWGYYLREALKGIRVNGLMSLASASTVAISLLVLALTLILAVNLQHMTDVLESQVQIVAYLQPDFDRQWTDELVSKARAIPHVERVDFVSKEEGLARLRDQLGSDAELLAAADEVGNPLPDALDVWVDDPAHIPGVVRALGDIESVDSVDYKQDVVKRLTTLSDGVRMLGLALVALLSAATLFIISNTIRLTVYARRREVAIMKLVGATNGFIRWPFLLEGAILGLAGALAAAATAWFGYEWFVRRVTEGLPFV
ncbi:MAG: ABC transporter permease, partial [Clostridia bacterium]|nr:ABC transporter permease [Clostridia bacterium]